MPVDINSWRAGIANRKYSHFVRVKQHVKGRLLDYAFFILRLYFYVYLFIAVTLITGPLSVCVAAATTIIYDLETVLSYLVSCNGILIPDSVVSNFVSLTLYVQATVFFLKPLGKFILQIGHGYIFQLTKLTRVYILTFKDKFSGILRMALFCYILLLGISQFFNLKQVIQMRLHLSGNVHPNPGPTSNSLKFCHWNLNGTCARDKIKISLIEAYNSVFHYDIIVFSETYCNESIKNEDILIEGFSKEILRSDHPNGRKEGRVCLYVKENLPIKRRKDLEFTQETIVCEISISRKKSFFKAMYRSPNQTNEEFEVFYERLQETIDRIKDKKPHCTILTGDLNCRSKQFWPDDIDSPMGIALDELIESSNLTQLIDQPINFESRGISCVDFIITDQPNLFVDYCIHSSLNNKCHHQIIHGKINISVPAPPPFKRTVWDYAKANKTDILKSLKNIDWESKFKDLSTNDMVQYFISTIMDIMSTFIPYKIVKFEIEIPHG